MVLLFLSACNTRRSSEPNVSQDIFTDSFEKKTETAEQIDEEGFIRQAAEELLVELVRGELHYPNLGTVYITIVNADGVNIHRYPSFQSDILFSATKNTRIAILGTSNNTDTIDGHTGRWLLIRNVVDWPAWRGGDPLLSFVIGQEQGWVFSKYIENGNIVPNEIRIIGLDTEPEHPLVARRLIGTYMNGQTEVLFSVRGWQWPNQHFWTFVWNSLEYFPGGNLNYRFDTIPGAYVWYPETNELKHVTHIAAFPDIAEATLPVYKLTDDFRFIVRQERTVIAHHYTLHAWQVDCGTLIYDGSFPNLSLSGHTLAIAYTIFSIDDFDHPLNPRDDDLIIFARDFVKNNDLPPNWLIGGGESLNTLMIIGEFNLDTGIRSFTTGEWVLRP
ncbi:MAG: SH3 domain-containing protein [Spirochaetes bacterium]|nr:SH3 domain-containing protein [Spirochaetota bacterium]